VWLDGNLYGCRIDAPISAAGSGAARLRSVPSEAPGEPRGDDAQETLARRFRRLRKQNGFSQGDLAERIGVSKPTVWAWEHGRARPQEARLKEIAEALGTTIEDLDGLPKTDDLAFSDGPVSHRISMWRRRK
jgi:DNA-binding XRE family transcriptional regulator